MTMTGKDHFSMLRYRMWNRLTRIGLYRHEFQRNTIPEPMTRMPSTRTEAGMTTIHPCPTADTCQKLLQCMKVKSLSHVRLFSTTWTAAYQAPPSMGFARQEYWSGVPLPSPGNLLYSMVIQVHASFTHFLMVLLFHIPLVSLYNL